MNTANWNIEPHPAGPSPVRELGASGAVPAGLGVVEGGEIPYLPEARKKQQENYANRLKLDPEIKCYLPGVPRATYQGMPFQIIQSTKHIMLIHEFAGAVRTIYMADQTEAPADSWMGWSNGRWEGETLVVDTKGFNDLSWFDRAGNFHSDALHVVERFTPAERGDAQLRGHNRGSQGVFAALEDEHAALQARRAERADSRIPVRGVRGRFTLWASAEAAGQVVR